ncbi:NADH-quinone oxidoreductase subunit L [Dasania sp. GY-MA-18]|uniref:NADH-quinone oxidoreductase subunit L n=1 Tax=Dasania phycosphaerae TaxID=2950436 RepID=A0A9J6RPC9_9GAMM|nr:MULTISPECIES: NADH-quinone oxidoreductase subunit L [Dasania]MCR8923727.1 NADH-quinone oxidoreductase subunit L [Dasania sp. GY-MA-18]MCZ0866161.1 NADH-quinone oxidoreductase subunit L [Dasania phycosphaerae]MCZ0869885.1 NADH-quinone oxidoreductase subunit L [Dasania phycosphaerae]
MAGSNYLWLIPFFPLLSATLLMVTAGQLPKKIIGFLGAGSIALSALCVALQAQHFLASGEIMQVTLWTWMSVANFAPGIAFYIDGLSIVMMSVITGVGFLIHLYSLEFMDDDSSYSRYFAYMNLFVAAMLLLVMADNLLLLYLGWEGVGVCSYLLVGFWYRDPANGKAARKAFVVTRVGDAAMALGLFLLFTELGSLDIQTLLLAADSKWQSGDLIPTIATALLLGGAVGKSAQLPLHTWLPDAMAGPTPVSALIHAATMVTAGVYLIARHYSLFLLAPITLEAVAWIGLATLLIAAFTALAQQDIKRILAYSTISQIGYMFLALGVGAFSAGIFHLMTHAFFKALLFLAAGAVIHCLHHEHNIFKMGGLRTRLPIVFWSFLIGSAALAALPFTSGFYSKDPILLSAWAMPNIGSYLWAGGLLGALLTAIYSFRLVFVVFFGEAKTLPNKQPGWKMSLPLALLCLLSIIGGWFVLPLDHVFPAYSHGEINHSVEIISIATPLIGLAIAYGLFLGKQLSISGFTQSTLGKALQSFCFSGWRFDALYQLLWVCPYQVLAQLWRNEPIDYLYRGIVSLMQWSNEQLSKLQSGELRWYATSMVFGLVILVLIMLRSLS